MPLVADPAISPVPAIVQEYQDEAGFGASILGGRWGQLSGRLGEATAPFRVILMDGLSVPCSAVSVIEPPKIEPSPLDCDVPLIADVRVTARVREGTLPAMEWD